MGSGSRPGSFRTRSTFATRSIPLLAPERDAAATENPTLIAKTSADDFAAQARLAPLGGPGRRVDGVLGERDEVAGFSVFDVRGHTHGHVAYWRESNRVHVLGDVVNNVHVRTGVPGLHEPPCSLPPTVR
jgi:hydroxyacylglutathione hydrolase